MPQLWDTSCCPLSAGQYLGTGLAVVGQHSNVFSCHVVSLPNDRWHHTQVEGRSLPPGLHSLLGPGPADHTPLRREPVQAPHWSANREKVPGYRALARHSPAPPPRPGWKHSAGSTRSTLRSVSSWAAITPLLHSHHCPARRALLVPMAAVQRLPRGRSFDPSEAAAQPDTCTATATCTASAEHPVPGMPVGSTQVTTCLLGGRPGHGQRSAVLCALRWPHPGQAVLGLPPASLSSPSAPAPYRSRCALPAPRERRRAAGSG